MDGRNAKYYCGEHNYGDEDRASPPVPAGRPAHYYEHADCNRHAYQDKWKHVIGSPN
jgi:hypothetical protein